MHILAIDTATESCGVALWSNGRLVTEITVHHGQTHARYLMEAVQAGLRLGGIALEQVDVLAATRGPGSFTGLRIGISTVKGMALAASKPIVGVSTLRALAFQADWGGDLICPMIDARRQEVYWSLYRRNGAAMEMIEPEQAAPIASVLARIDRPCAFIGSGARVYHHILQESLYARLPAAEERHLLRPSMVAQLAGDAFRDGHTDDLESFSPVYLRSSDAEKNHRSS